MKKALSVAASRMLSAVAKTSVSVASPWWYHRAQAPEQLLKK